VSQCACRGIGERHHCAAVEDADVARVLVLRRERSGDSSVIVGASVDGADQRLDGTADPRLSTGEWALVDCAYPALHIVARSHLGRESADQTGLDEGHDLIERLDIANWKAS
jgi:hypothetical protein